MKKNLIAVSILLAAGAANAATSIPYTFTGTLAAARVTGICTFLNDADRVDFDFTGSSGSDNVKLDDADIAITCTPDDGVTQNKYVLSVKGDDQSSFTNRARAYMTSFKLAAPAGAPSASDFDYSAADATGGSLPGFEGFASVKLFVSSVGGSSAGTASDFFNGTNTGTAFTITTGSSTVAANIRIAGKIQSLGSFNATAPSPARYNPAAADSDWIDTAPSYGPYVNQNPLQDNRIYLIAADTTSSTPTGPCTSLSPDCLIDLIPDQLPF